MYREEEELSKIRERRGALTSAVSDIEERRLRAESRIAQINAQLPEVVLRAAMGETEPDAPARLRRELQELRDAIEDAELVLKPAHVMETRLNGEEQKRSRRLARRKEYEGLKAMILETPTRLDEFKELDLRAECEYLDGDTADADALIKKAQAKKVA